MLKLRSASDALAPGSESVRAGSFNALHILTREKIPVACIMPPHSGPADSLRRNRLQKRYGLGVSISGYRREARMEFLPGVIAEQEIVSFVHWRV